MANLAINIKGMKAPNPFFLASATPTSYGKQIARAFEAGWGGAVTKTVGIDPIVNVTNRFGRLAPRGSRVGGNNIVGFENIELITDRTLEAWLLDIRFLKERYPDHAVVASLMHSVEEEGWRQLVQQVQDAGADAIELNFGCPHGMPEKHMGSEQSQNPDLAEMITGWTKKYAKVPVFSKLTPNVTDIGLIGQACERGGADGISTINTILSMIGIDIEKVEPMPDVSGQTCYGGYSGTAVKPVALRCISTLREKTSLPIFGIGGINYWEDAVEHFLAGASAVQVCTAVMLRGFRIIDNLTKGLNDYMDRKGFNTVDEMVGLVVPKVKQHSGLEFKRREVALIDQSKCISCDLCYIACNDGVGLEAIGKQLNVVQMAAGVGAADGGSDISEARPTYQVIAEKCDGCSLCTHVCPVKDCITLVESDVYRVPPMWRPEEERVFA
jgi:dihydropyrimidine dehydrogenase (NAD+) subunit PreA